MYEFFLVFIVITATPTVLAIFLLARRDRIKYRSRKNVHPLITKYNRKGLCWGIPGFLLMHGGSLVLASYVGGSPEFRQSGFLCGLFAGWLFLFVGLRYYAKAKGRNPAWAWLALLGAVGVVALGLLRNLSDRFKTDSSSPDVIVRREHKTNLEKTEDSDHESSGD